MRLCSSGPRVGLALVAVAVALTGCAGPGAGTTAPTGSATAQESQDAVGPTAAGEPTDPPAAAVETEPSAPGSVPAGYRWFELYEVRFYYPDTATFDPAHRWVDFPTDSSYGGEALVAEIGHADVELVGADESVTIAGTLPGQARTERCSSGGSCNITQTVLFRVPGGPQLDNEIYDYLYKITWYTDATTDQQIKDSLARFHDVLAMAQAGDQRPGITEAEAEDLLLEDLVRQGYYGDVDAPWQDVIAGAGNPPALSLVSQGDYHGRPTYCYDVSIERTMNARAAVRSSGYVYYNGDGGREAGDETEIGDEDTTVTDCVA